ncbi:hypothetical protein M3Y99_01723200 [Aphelenchoides fujianensis]|nr:hypothetical protein M3Y99_01723200 [Aphelenchoides fujianensis]
MILPEEGVEQWTICLSYDTDTQLDPAHPGRFPVEQCGEQNDESFVDGFVAIHVKYNGTNQTEVFVLSAQNDVWFRLGDEFVPFDLPKALVFDFYRNPGRDHLALHGYPSRFYVPEFYDEENITLALAFNSTGIRSVHS